MCLWLVCLWDKRPQGEGASLGRPAQSVLIGERRLRGLGWRFPGEFAPCFVGSGVGLPPGGGVCAEHRILNIVYFFYIGILCCRFM